MDQNLIQAADTLDYVLSLDLPQCHIEVCIASGEPDQPPYEFRRVNQTPALENKFREAIAESLEKYHEQRDEGNIELHDFAAETVKEEQTIECLNLLPYDSLKDQIKPVDNYSHMAHFQHDERAFIKKMRFYVVRVQPPQGRSVNLYQHYSPTQMLSQSRLFAMVFQKNLYDDLVDPTFLFERHFDCFSCDDFMFILQKNNFFNIFDIGELKKVASETLLKLEHKDLIHNFQEFKADCLNDKNKILKLKNISSRPYLDTLTIDVLKKTIDRYSLPIQVDILANGKKKMVYNRKQRWDILNVLDDAYADSPMTKSSYFVKGKREIRRK